MGSFIFICNCFTCLWQFQELFAKRKAPFQYCTFTSCCNEAAENKAEQQQKLRSHCLFGQHILRKSPFKIIDSSEIEKEYTQHVHSLAITLGKINHTL